MILSTTPCAILSATLIPNVAGYIHTAVGLQFPTLRYNLNTRRANINLIVKSTDGKSFDDLYDLLPSAEDTQPIPKTIIFHDNIDRGCAMADEMVKQLPPFVSGVPRDKIVLCYYSSLDKQSKSEIHQSFLRGETRILICTDAYGLGIDIPDVVRVIQWWVDEKFTIFGVQQRMGRAVRDPSLVGVGVVYVQKSILNDIREGEWQSAWSDPNQFPEDEWDPDTGGIRVIPVSKSCKLPLFGLPVRKEFEKIR